MSDPAAAASPSPAPEPAASAASPPQSEPIDYAATAREGFSLLRAGGALGVAGVTVCILLFVLACFGLDAAFRAFPWVPLIASIAGILLTLVGAVWRAPRDEDPYLLFGLFTNGMALFSALLEMGVGNKWNL